MSTPSARDRSAGARGRFRASKRWSMKLQFFNRSWSLAFLPILASSACGSPSSEGGSENPNGAPPLAAVSVTPEIARIQEFIDRRYLASDVKYSFTTQFGQKIDCIDFYDQPGVKALRAQGIEPSPVAPPLPAPLRTASGKGRSELELGGSVDENGNLRDCPDGTVAQVHFDAEAIQRAGGLDAFVSKMTHKAPPPPAGGATPPCATSPDYSNYAHVRARYTGTTGPIYSNISHFSINNPLVNQNEYGDHSLAQTWTLSGTGINDFGCTCTTGSDCIQSVEVGWDVDQYWNSYFGRSAGSTTVFIFSTNDGYSTGCYDGLSGPGCLTWIGTPGATLVPGYETNLPVGLPGQQQHEVAFIVARTSPGWYIYSSVDGGNWGAMGYYPYTNYYGTMQNYASGFRVGGEIYDGTGAWVTPMGSGVTPNGGYGNAAYHRDYEICNMLSCDTTFVTEATRPSDYTFSTSPAQPPGTTSNAFYYGSAAHVFWNGDYGRQNWPNGTDWLPGSYKGTCGQSADGHGQPVVGLSEYLGPHNAHAVECWNQGSGTITNTGACYTRQFGPGDNRGYTGDGDWDFGYTKGECRIGEYVAGVAQTTSGQLDGILCCPANLSGASCKAEVFYVGNGDYTGPDWDYGYYKGTCTGGGYVQGVSSVLSSSQGVVGAPHAVLCCH